MDISFPVNKESYFCDKTSKAFLYNYLNAYLQRNYPGNIYLSVLILSLLIEKGESRKNQQDDYNKDVKKHNLKT